MIQAIFLTKMDIVKAQKKLAEVHNIFINPNERDATIDFANCLKPLLRPGTARDFLTACDQASRDLSNPKKVPETYDSFTVGVMRDMADVFAKEIFSTDFAKEVEKLMKVPV